MPPSRAPSDNPLEASDDDRTEVFKLDQLLDTVEQAPPPREPVLVCLIGSAQGTVYRLGQGPCEIGRDGRQIRLTDEGVSRRHARVDRLGDTVTLQDLGSTNGTICRGVKIPVGTATPLQEGDRIHLGRNVVLRLELHDALESQLRDRLYRLATRDPLTGALNRRALQERLAAELGWHMRHRAPCAVIAMDIDFFKRINDTYGHAAGDYVLREFSKGLLSTIRTEDVLARIGGEEFIIVARATTKPAAVQMADRLRGSVEAREFVWTNTRLPVTMSCGVATSDEPGADQQDGLLALADERLYEAKRNGRNRVGS